MKETLFRAFLMGSLFWIIFLLLICEDNNCEFNLFNTQVFLIGLLLFFLGSVVLILVVKLLRNLMIPSSKTSKHKLINSLKNEKKSNVISNTTSNKMKIIGYTLLFIIIGLTLLGVFSDFVANEDILIYFIYGGICFSLVILFFVLTQLLREGSGYIERMENQGKSPLIGIIALVIMVPAITTASSYKGLPVALNYILGSQSEIVVTTRSKPIGYYNKRCSGKIYLQNYNYFTNNFICGISESDWRTLERGNKLILLGKKSIFGIKYERYSVLKER